MAKITDGFEGFETPQQTDLPSQQQPWSPPGNWSGRQPDETQLGDARSKIRHRVKSQTRGDWGTGRPILPQLRFSPKTSKITAANTWQLIMPQNERRINYIVCNQAGVQVQMSFGRPIGNLGILIGIGQTAVGAGYTCPIDEIYILSPTANVFIVAYEGIPTTKDFGPRLEFK